MSDSYSPEAHEKDGVPDTPINFKYMSQEYIQRLLDADFQSSIGESNRDNTLISVDEKGNFIVEKLTK